MNSTDRAAVKTELDRLTAEFFRAVSFEEGAAPPYEKLHALFVKAGLLVKNTGATPEISSVSQFIEPRRASVRSGELTRFNEMELLETTHIFGNVAHRFSAYAKSGTLKTIPFAARGMISTQFVLTPSGWKISAMAWDDERPGLSIPEPGEPSTMTQGVASKRQSRIASLPAKPHPVSLDSASCAVIVIDMQNDFGTEGGMFHRAGIDISMIQRAVEPTRKTLVAAREIGIPVIYLKMGFRPDLSDAGPVDCPNHARHRLLGVGSVVLAPDGRESRVLVRDTWNTDIVLELTPDPTDIVLYKHRFSGFFETELDAVLKRLGAKHLIVTGCTTSICVESTIRDAMFRDYSCVLLEDCTGEPIGHNFDRSNHDASLLSIEVLLGWTSSSEEFVKALESSEIKRPPSAP